LKVGSLHSFLIVILNLNLKAAEEAVMEEEEAAATRVAEAEVSTA
jgi:hypothetical protein